MSAQRNLALMRRLFREVWNEGRFETITELLADNAEITAQGGADATIRGPAQFIAFIERIRKEFPDMKITVEDAFGIGNKVAVRWSATMTHHRDHLCISTTCEPVRLTGIMIARMRNEKIVEGWNNWDQLATIRQRHALTGSDGQAASSTLFSASSVEELSATAAHVTTSPSRGTSDQGGVAAVTTLKPS